MSQHSPDRDYHVRCITRSCQSHMVPSSRQLMFRAKSYLPSCRQLTFSAIPTAEKKEDFSSENRLIAFIEMFTGIPTEIGISAPPCGLEPTVVRSSTGMATRKESVVERCVVAMLVPTRAFKFLVVSALDPPLTEMPASFCLQALTERQLAVLAQSRRCRFSQSSWNRCWRRESHCFLRACEDPRRLGAADPGCWGIGKGRRSRRI